MNGPRRTFLKRVFATSGAMALGTTVLPPTVVGAVLPQDALKAKSDTLDVPEEIFDEDIISIKTPKLAENGQVVPISVTANLDKVESIEIIVETNPIPSVCKFNFPDPEKAVGWVKTRIKIARPANATVSVVAVVKADGKLYRASSPKFQVTVGGCGG